MATLPYVTSAKNIEKTLLAIKDAAVPEKVSLDFIKTILKIPGGSGDQMSTFLKKINFVSSDGRPTELYKQFRNPSTSKQAVATGIKHAYAPLYIRNEFMHELSEEDLLKLITEETGLAHDSNPVKLAFSNLKALIKQADFDEQAAIILENNQLDTKKIKQPSSKDLPETLPQAAQLGLNLSYTINLNLPATSDQAVFNAIFKSLKEHLLSNNDG